MTWRIRALITIKHELEDIFVIKSGLDVRDKIVLEGVREVERRRKGGIRVS